MEFVYGRFEMSDRDTTVSVKVYRGIQYHGYTTDWNPMFDEPIIIPRFWVHQHPDAPAFSTALNWIRHALTHYSWLYDLIKVCATWQIADGFKLVFRRLELQDELHWLIQEHEPTSELETKIDQIDQEIEIFVKQVSA